MTEKSKWELDTEYRHTFWKLVDLICAGNHDEFVSYIETCGHSHIFRSRDFGDNVENNLTPSKIFYHISTYLYCRNPQGTLCILKYVRTNIGDLSKNGRMTRRDKIEYMNLLSRLSVHGFDSTEYRSEKRIVSSMWRNFGYP